MATFVKDLIGLSLSLCIGLVCPAQQKSGIGASLDHAPKAPDEARSSLDEARKAIAAGDQLYFQAFANGDPALLIHLYTGDCWIMPPKGPTLCGPDAPLELFQTAFKGGLRNGRLITAEIFGDGVYFVTEEGFWECYGDGHRLLDRGSFLALWRKTPDGWKMFRQSFHSDQE